MTRDYKNARPREDKKPVPGWLWLATGLLIGLLVALVVYLSGQPSGKTLEKVVKQHQVAKKKAVSKPKPKKAKDNGLRYEFYTILEKNEVVIPETEKTKVVSSRSAKKASYNLQAGSFRRQQDAESMKARLALIGIESNVEAVTIKGETWHRILIGPYTSIRQINQVQNRLRQNDINSILMKVKG